MFGLLPLRDRDLFAGVAHTGLWIERCFPPDTPGLRGPAGRGGDDRNTGRRGQQKEPTELQAARELVRQARTFTPQIVRERQRPLSGVDVIVLSLYAKGLTTIDASRREELAAEAPLTPLDDAIGLALDLLDRHYLRSFRDCR